MGARHALSIEVQKPTSIQITTFQVIDVEEREERREDPADGTVYSFTELKEAYSTLYSPDEIQEYWNQNCQETHRIDPQNNVAYTWVEYLERHRGELDLVRLQACWKESRSPTAVIDAKTQRMLSISPAAPVQSSLTNTEKLFLKAVKAVRQIEKLEETQAAGGNLDKGQKQKIQRKAEAWQELRDMAQLLPKDSDLKTKHKDL